MSLLTEERLTTLSEIATDCFDVDFKDDHALDDRILVKPADIVRALESAYDMGLIAGYHLTHGKTRAR
ncbi:hypothetical protein [Caballeronia cordobensis]|uniref:Uncharacterized protein n=1 Tax=Caballeronia cordobensis TaxID=1353886 RepID=A0A158IB38_CABCO|nr:hypothetical protein [Caballeronia cordobensis]AQH03279.1 hypothetical protein A9R05_31065 [Burkholderia sp. KK1]BAO91014.1 uncharacterized protein BRPE67_CCDS14120 [Burkholderia sp. RPE67]SAL53489.1 hypothetical protein AWB70_04467 [Caballeronia cordobensis]